MASDQETTSFLPTFCRVFWAHVKILNQIRGRVAYKTLEMGQSVPVFGRGLKVIICEMEMKAIDFRSIYFSSFALFLSS